MRTQAFIALAALAIASGASATTPSKPAPAPQPTPSAAPVQGNHYTTEETDIGTLLDDPASNAILTKYFPELVKSDNIAMARGMTLRAIQPYAQDMITDEKLTAVDAELAKLPAKK